MLYKSHLVSDMSGSMCGLTASHNRGGRYFRCKVKPTDPATRAQRRARQSFSNVAADYAKLSPTEQQSWRDYAQRIPRRGPLGDPVQLSGQQMYNRSKLYAKNVNEIAGATPLVVPLIAPPGSTLPAFEESPILTQALESSQAVEVSFITSEPWVSEDGASMTISVSPPQGAGVEFFKGPFQQALTVFGDSTTPPSSPVNVFVPFPIVAGQKLWLRILLFQGPGGLSGDLIEGPITVDP